MSEDDLEALVRLDFYHWHNEAVAKHDLWVNSNTVSEHCHVKLLTLIRADIHLGGSVSELVDHAAFESAPWAYLGVPTD